MKIKEKLNVKKVVAKSNKNQEKLDELFNGLDAEHLSKNEKTELLSQLNEVEDLALSIKEKLNT